MMKHFSHFRPVALLKYALPLMLLMTSASAKASNEKYHPQRQSGHAYFVHKDGAMILDKTTNLVWQRCSVGQAFDSATGCVGQARQFTFEQAQQLSKDGWRVPTISELQTLRVCSTGFDTKKMVDLQNGGKQVASKCNNNATTPTINTKAFPNTTFDLYWSSSPNVGYSNYAWGVGVRNGYVDIFNRSYVNYVRLVRTSRSLGNVVASEFVTPLEKSYHQQRQSGEAYVVHKNGTMILDKTTNLVWQRCSVGQAFDSATGCVGQARQFTFEQAQQLSKDGWRVPTISELQTLRVCSTGFDTKNMIDLQNGGKHVASKCNNNSIRPAINTKAFPYKRSDSISLDLYWSSSPYVGYSDNAWLVYFYGGYVLDYHRFNDYYVRLVRASQSLGDAVALEFVTPLEEDTFAMTIQTS